jgi:hypothetical protein
LSAKVPLRDASSPIKLLRLYLPSLLGAHDRGKGKRQRILPF